MNQQQKNLKVTKDILMSDLVFAHPEAAEVLMDYGLHCIGCAANSFDTIEMGAKVHGMSDEEINEMMTRVNNLLSSSGLTRGSMSLDSRMHGNDSKKIHKVTVDRKACIGAATCIIVAPDAFELDDENIAVVKPGALSLSDDVLLMAAQSCPTSAIILYDENGNQIFPKSI